MHFSKSQSVLTALAVAKYASAHTVFTNFYINGVDQGAGVAVRMNKNTNEASWPIDSITGNNMACGFSGDQGVSRVATVPDGSTLTFQYLSWPDDKSKPSLDPGHKGPCAVYLKKVDSATEDTATGDGWFKIWDEGYDGEKQEWCTNKVIDNGGLLSVALPANLEGGYYLVRPELLALHNALNGDPQFYVGCGQIFLESTGNLGPAETVSIPGYVKTGEDSVSWNLYYGTDPNNYPVPGPSVATLQSGASARKASQTTQTTGQKPDGCIVQNANWCAFEVPTYTDEAGCWASSKECWAQNKECWNQAPSTGGSGCKIMETKCNNMDDQCNAGNWNGPPNANKVLDPAASTINIGNLWPTSGGSIISATAAVPSSSVAAVATSSPAAVPVSEVASPSSAVPVYSEATPVVAAPSSVEEAEPEYTPATTAAPVAGSYGGGNSYVTLTELVEVTEVEYVTVYDKRRRAHVRRHAHHHY